MKDEKQKWYFNECYETYQSARLGYADDVYQIISSICGFNSNSKILEVGAGSGIATNEIYKKWHPDLTVVEPGDHFVSLLKHTFATKNIKIIGCKFESFYSIDKYDGIISATAFHWIDKSIKYKKASDLLTGKGYLVLYWNNYSVFDSEINNEISSIYKHYNEQFECNYQKQLLKIEKRRKDIEESAEFTLVEHKEIENIITVSSNDFLALLETFIGHCYLDKRINTEIYNLLESNGGIIDLRVLVNLEIAQKKEYV